MSACCLALRWNNLRFNWCNSERSRVAGRKINKGAALSRPPHLGVLVEVHAGFCGDVLGADDLTVSLKGLELEELGCREELQGTE